MAALGRHSDSGSGRSLPALVPIGVQDRVIEAMRARMGTEEGDGLLIEADLIGRAKHDGFIINVPADLRVQLLLAAQRQNVSRREDGLIRRAKGAVNVDDIAADRGGASVLHLVISDSISTRSP